jgi:hypothetical protein
MSEGEDGSVARDVVVLVLQKYGVSLKSESGLVTLFRDGIPEAYRFPEHIPRKMLHRLHVRFNVPIEHFYHPEMCSEGGTRIN